MWHLDDCRAHLSRTLCWGRTHCRYSTCGCTLLTACFSCRCKSRACPISLFVLKRLRSIYELSSFDLQAEIGDYEPDQPRPLDYIGQLTFAPNQNKEMEEKILELHKSHRSESERSWSQKWSFSSSCNERKSFRFLLMNLNLPFISGEWPRHRPTPSF